MKNLALDKKWRNLIIGAFAVIVIAAIFLLPQSTTTKVDAALNSSGINKTTNEVNFSDLEELESAQLETLYSEIKTLFDGESDAATKAAESILLNAIGITAKSKEIDELNLQIDATTEDCARVELDKKQLENIKELKEMSDSFNTGLIEFANKYPAKSTELNIYPTGVNELIEQTDVETYENMILFMEAICAEATA